MLHHETHNGWSTEQTAGRLKQLAAEYAGEGIGQSGEMGEIGTNIRAVGQGRKYARFSRRDWPSLMWTMTAWAGVTDQAGGFALHAGLR